MPFPPLTKSRCHRSTVPRKISTETHTPMPHPKNECPYWTNLSVPDRYLVGKVHYTTHVNFRMDRPFSPALEFPVGRRGLANFAFPRRNSIPLF